MTPSWAKPGAKVVCVDAGRFVGKNITVKYPPDHVLLVEGEIYTIRDVIAHEHEHILGVRVEEIARHILRDDSYEQPWALYRFRPVVEQKDDIALFTHLLNTTSEDQLIKEEA